MTVTIRRVDLESERIDLLDILQRNLRDLSHERRFEWLYHKSPAGPAWSWFAYENDTKRPVGVASVFPRAIWVGKQVRQCGQVGDFAIDMSHRSLGPALLLQRATFEPVDRGFLAFCYDCPPNDQGMTTFRRLGIHPHCQMLRYARLMRTDREVTKRLGHGTLAAGAALVGNRLLRFRTARKNTAQGLEISLHTSRFEEEFSFLDQQVAGGAVIRARRDAADLNWRYRDNPLQEYEVLTARRQGELVAYIVFAEIEQDVYLIDLFGRELGDVGLELLHAAIAHLKDPTIQTVQAHISPGSCLLPTLQKAHFRYRSSAARVVAYARPGGEVADFLAMQPAWSFTHSDVLA